jgi:hypothetical protein
MGSNPTGGMDVCLLWVLCVVRQRSLQRADHLSRGVLPTVVRHCVWSGKPQEWGDHDPCWVAAQRERERERRPNILELLNNFYNLMFQSFVIFSAQPFLLHIHYTMRNYQQFCHNARNDSVKQLLCKIVCSLKMGWWGPKHRGVGVS